MNPKVSIIVVTYNQHDLLLACLRSVEKALEGLDGEVIVIDNASSDGTPRLVAEQFPSVRLIANRVNLYYTRAVNQGMRAARGQYAYLLNDDTVLAPDNLRELIAFMDAHPRCGVAGPALRDPSQKPQVSAQKFPTPLRDCLAALGIAYRLRNARWADRFQKQYTRPLGLERVDWVCGGAIFLRREAMVELGLHDEHYLFYFDDPDIGMRMKLAGHEVWYVPTTHVLHYHGMSTVKTPRKLRFDIIFARSRRHYFRKFFGLVGMLAVEVGLGLAAGLRALLRLVTGRFSDARAQWAKVRTLREANRMPAEEVAAIEGYRSCEYNGLGDAAAPSAQSPAPLVR